MQHLNNKRKILALAVSAALLSACGSGGGGSGASVGSNNNSGVSSVRPSFDVSNTTNQTGTYAEAALADKKAAVSGEGAYIGLIDTGIKRDAKGLVNRNNRISSKVIDYKINARDQLVNSIDTDGHGTRMVEIMVDTANKVVVNSGVNSVGDVSAGYGAFNLLRAMDLGVKVDVLNNSYGFDVNSDNPQTEYGRNYHKIKNDGLAEYYKAFINRNTLVVKATGNEGRKLSDISANLPLVYPEMEKGFVAVTAWDQVGNNKTQNDCGLAKNWCVTAPEVFNTYGLDQNKSLRAGTSNATAYVSALAARIKSRYDWFSNEDLKNTLLTTADDKGEKGVDSVWGHGLVNANKSLQGYGRFDKQQVLKVSGSKKAYFFDNDISGRGGLTKQGNDILVLNGNNTYTGQTLIQAGELVANGNSVSAHNVAKNARLTIGDSANTINLGAVTNAGTLDVQAANLQVNGNLDNRNGKINQAIGSKITVSGSANLSNSTLTLTGVRNGYVTKKGSEETLLQANQGLTATSLSVQLSNTNLGELINRSYTQTKDKLTVKFTRDSVGNVVRNKTQFTGRDQTVRDLDGLLDKMDLSKLNENNYKTMGSMATQTAGVGIVQALTASTNLNETVFAMSTATAQHAQQQMVREKAHRADHAIGRALSATREGNMWVEAGFGKTKAKGLADVHGESRDDSQTLGLAQSFGANSEHGISLQVSRLSHRWSESMGSVEKDVDTRGAGVEFAYSHKLGQNYWLAATAGVDAFKAKSAYGSDKGHQYLLGLSFGKVFQWNHFSLMPQLGVKHMNVSGVDYYLGRFNGDNITVRHAKTNETGLTAGLDGLWQFGQDGRLSVNAGVRLYQALNGKTRYTADYGGHQVSKSEKATGHRPDIGIHAGVGYRATEHFSVNLVGGYENGKFRQRRYVNVGLGYRF